MSEPIRLTTPLTQDKVRSLHIGDRVLISGTIYAARDAAHKRMVETLDRGEPLPVDLRDQIVYYVGPSPAKPGQAIGSAGPTTSGRMDAYARANDREVRSFASISCGYGSRAYHRFKTSSDKSGEIRGKLSEMAATGRIEPASLREAVSRRILCEDILRTVSR